MAPPPVTGLPFFLAPVSADGVGDTITLTGQEAHHAVVRRIRRGEKVAVTDGRGALATAVVVESSRAALVLRVDSIHTVPRPEPRLSVVQAIPKGERAERTVEVLTEVGVDRILPWTAARCVSTWRGDRVEKAVAKWRSSARESAKQARRAWLPEVSGPVSTAEVGELLREADLGLVLHEAADEALAALPVPAAGSVVVVVGPEGGLTDAEVEELRAAGGHVVGLGESVLRTSTAGVAAAAALLSRTPRWH